MKTDGVVAVRRRRSRAAGERLVSEFEQSGLGRKAFCAAQGLNLHTLDAWRKRVAQSRRDQEIVPIEIVDDHAMHGDARPPASMGRTGQFRIVLAQGLRIEVESGFDASELRRLIAALGNVAAHGCLPQSV